MEELPRFHQACRDYSVHATTACMRRLSTLLVILATSGASEYVCGDRVTCKT